ncbi:cupin domain-containing protein [Pseudoalteromonas sp. MMG010]|uniref:cupin domain-containing protein n=1 Tax=Pseudoalteromonas sp. MMG010 TaxID=2822685 RepID=UPI001B3A665E|nr:cupin domain-containing protein [Pseudoalteromonas sp. MMG010]MBQ4834033.1 cupin domain-containing protein [Pseudoalteromonas sp. MMG010]
MLKQLTCLLFCGAFFSPYNYAHNAQKNYTAEQVIEYLGLKGHVEGGFYKRTYQANNTATITTQKGERFSMTSIFYLLSAESPIGHFHLNRSDIVHYFQLGDPITYYLIDPNGVLSTVVMGTNLAAGEQLQVTVPGGTWKASKIVPGGHHGYSLISEAVSPGFDFADMTLGYHDLLITQFPQHKALIMQLSPALPPEK